MWKKISKNLWIKIFCLLASAILWIFVAAGQSTVGRYPGSIKIKALNVPSGFSAIYDIQVVNIKIMAEPSVWGKLSSESFSAYVDLSNKAEGTYELPVNVVSSIPGVQIVEKDPENIFVRLDPLVTKEIPIKAKLEGSAADGWIAGDVVLEPDKTQIRGPKGVLDNITEAIANINLSGESEKFEKVIRLTAIDQLGENISEIEFLPSEVKAIVPIVKASNNKTVGIKVKTNGVPKTGYFISEVSSNPSVVDVIGDNTVLKDVSYIETTAIDVSQQSQTIEKEVSLDIKSGISLQKDTSTRVKVRIVFSKNELTKEVTASINPVNLSSAYSVKLYNPLQVQVLCSGPSDQIEGLNSPNVILDLDFQGQSLSGENPVVNIEVTKNSFRLPSGINILSFLPASIRVELTKR